MPTRLPYWMALIFLVLLYDSPAGLVFYWTLNNLFSLIKNIFYKLPNPKKVIGILCSIVGIAILISGLIYFTGIRRKVLTVLVAAALQLPMFKKRIKILNKESGENADNMPANTAKTIFFACSVFMALLVGVLIPSAILSTSTAEFVEMKAYHSPLTYLVRAAAISGLGCDLL